MGIMNIAMEVIDIVMEVMEVMETVIEVMEVMEIVIEVVGMVMKMVMEVTEVASHSVVRAIASCRMKLRGFKGGETISQGWMQG